MRRKYSKEGTSCVCKVCSSEFFVSTAYVIHARKHGKPDPVYCGRACMGKGQRNAPSKQFIMDRSVPEPNSGCWIWLGSIWTQTGYGRLQINDGERSKPVGAHRVSYLAFNGDIPAGEQVRHKCDNPICVNPVHLDVGTSKQNKGDSIERKRHAHGSKSWNASLKESDIPNIRLLLQQGTSQSEVARRYGVRHGVIFNIAHAVTWRHVG